MKKSIILGVLLIFVLAGCALTKNNEVAGVKILNIEEASARAEKFINDNLMPAGQTATVKEVVEENGLYKVVVDAGNGQNIDSYMTKDGGTFFPQAMDTAKTTPDNSDSANQPVAQEAAPIDGENEYVKGNKEATVDVIEYSDFECPYCLRHTAAMDQIFNDYKDKIRVVFRHFPLSFHAEAQKAAEASECAGEQGKFWEMHDKIFKANEAKNMSVAQWKTEAKNLGLNTAQFNACLDSGKYADKIKKQTAGGQAAGVTGTPATFINGQMFSGAVGYDTLKQAIEKELSK
ncbi:hypothetical protein COT99_01700 [Candidatus Falkowbacteria bacterium CG10_big_fil_rev_8_21_14_0_10_43_10]|uniref:Thioredoxin domain-containing protein n=1 Tax=Candidatus Falkowbacteria bacterium CG10_big_fil_rev_8_21_14_0_10_43_10 TaxID=1974567 RepID=A0A2H0V4A2_9BACT|nr:MAG: hypothetical protein COT99_01700 [Candidatus Falkowbacteria bacterium CG10_big_fil_rev_8_21_14_0_10_43_10]